MAVNENAKAQNRSIADLFQDMMSEKLIARPSFQRELVWNEKHQQEFIDTILKGLPFPEIYLATGEMDVAKVTTKEWLVDGRQRLSTISEYILGNLVCGSRIPTYQDLDDETKVRFLEFNVVARHLGKIPVEEIIEVFKRINSTRYPLNRIELRHAIYQGPLIDTANRLADLPFFSDNRVFSPSAIKRMKDTEFLLTVICTLLGGAYFHQDGDIDDMLDMGIEEFLQRFNDAFPEQGNYEQLLTSVIDYLGSLDLGSSSRWVTKQADLFTLIVELSFFIRDNSLESIDKKLLIGQLQDLEQQIDMARKNLPVDQLILQYWDAVASGTRKRSARIARGQVIGALLLSCSKG